MAQSYHSDCEVSRGREPGDLGYPPSTSAPSHACLKEDMVRVRVDIVCNL